MARDASLKTRCGVTARNPLGAAVCCGAASCRRSSFKRALNSSRGRSLRFPAMRNNGARLASTSGAASGLDSIACTASSSCSIMLCLGMFTTEFRPQGLQPAKLKLLDRALAPLEFLGNLLDALPLRKAHPDHPPLVGRQLRHHAEQLCALFGLLGIPFVDRLGRIFYHFSGTLAPAVGDHVICDPHQPRSERHAAPVEIRQRRQGLVKYVGGQILRHLALPNALHDERVNSLKMRFVEFRKLRRVLLRSLDEEALVRL